MTVGNEKLNGSGGREVQRPIVLWPGLAALAALALYGLTLNHWVTLGSLPFASQLTGWDWHPGPLPWRANPQYPLFLLLTLPLRLLPADWRAVGLNVFSAACAALTLAILARSVRLFPQDRTKEQRLREGGEFSLLSVRAAFLPAAFAVLLLAAQLSFWQNAVAGSGEMIDLLVFAFLILCLLEFRISQDERRLRVFTFVYGLGVANNWALIGFFPCFLLAMLWIKRLGFFNWRFVLRLTGWGVLGLLLYGLIPLLGVIHDDGSFLELLLQKLAEQHIYLFRLRRYYAAIAGVSTLVPLFFAAINWPSFEGEVNAGAHNITQVLFRLLHFVFLTAGILMFFDVKFSPSPRNMGVGVMGGPAFLTFYYLAALSVGYFSGYVLLVFGKDVVFRWGQATGILRVVNRMVVGLLWLAAFGLPAVLFYVNYQHIRDFNSPVVADFGREMAKSLPARSAIVLADDPARLYLAMGASQRLGLTNEHIFIESRCLLHREYLRYLADRYPAFRKEIVDPESLTNAISGLQIGDLLAHLTQRQPVYYLHPSFGNFFEQVCMTPRRLGADLHPCPSNVLETPRLKPPEMAANQAYWHALEKQELASVAALAKVSPEGLPERSADAVRIASYYSQILDYWGTELQKAGTERGRPDASRSALLNDANEQFAEALRLNPDNTVARLNQQWNAHLRGVPPTGRQLSSSELADNAGSWESIYNSSGPADEPYLDISAGRYFALHGGYLQAAHLFQRCLEMSPNDAVAELDLARTYIDMGLADAGLREITNLQARAANNSPEQTRVNPLDLAHYEVLAYYKKTNFAQADKLLTDTHSRYPKDEAFSRLMAEFYQLMGYRVLYEGNGEPGREQEAAKWFRKSVAALDDELQLLNAPMQAVAKAQVIPGVNLQKAEMQMMLKDYNAAILTLTTIVRQDPDNPLPLLDRAISELQLGNYEAAKKDYQACEKMRPGPTATSSILYYGLGQIAQKEKDKAAEIRYDKLYLQYAPPNTVEFTNVTKRLHELEGR